MPMDMIRKGLAGFFAALFVLTALLALLFFNLERNAFSAETYQRAFANDNFYERLPAILAQVLASPAQQETLPFPMRALSAEQWEKFIRGVLPPEALQQMGDEALTSLFSYLNGETATAVVSLTPLKSNMAGEAGTQAVINLIETLPACTLTEIAKMTMAFLNNQEFALCNPPVESDSILRPALQGQLQIVAASLPEQMTIASDVQSPEGNPHQRIQALRLGLRLTPLLPLLFLFGMSLLAVRSLRDWLAWWGIPFFITGLLSSFIAWVGAPLAGLLLLNLLVRKAPSYLPPILLENGSQLASAIMDQIFKPLFAQGLILLLVGIALTALTFVVQRWTPYRQAP
jgi:hypothetical protein